MKKLKFLTLAAIAAATAMVSSCSDNDVLEGVKDTGIPFSVTASTNSGGSRGSDITSLSNFQLWGFGLDQAKHFDGDNFTPKAGSPGVFESSVTPNWPNTNNCLFYAISDNTSDMAYDVEAGSPGVNSTKAEIRNGSFNYTIPTNVADQKDLLVAAATGNSNDGVHLKFDHALAVASELHLLLDPTKTAQDIAYNESGAVYAYVVKIKKIIIHNIKTTGTYTFDGATKNGDNYVNGSWDTGLGTRGSCVIDFGDNPFIVHHKYGTTYNQDVNIGNIYFIPQTISPLGIIPNDPDKTSIGIINKFGTDEEDKKLSYVEFEAIAFDYCVDDVISVLSGAVGSELTQDEAGNYLREGKIIANADGFVTDLDDEFILNNCYGETQLCSPSFTFTYNFSDIADPAAYGSAFTPFNAVLSVNGKRRFNINLDQAIIHANDGSALFGVAGEAGGGAKKY